MRYGAEEDMVARDVEGDEGEGAESEEMVLGGEGGREEDGGDGEEEEWERGAEASETASSS